MHNMDSHPWYETPHVPDLVHNACIGNNQRAIVFVLHAPSDQRLVYHIQHKEYPYKLDLVRSLC